MYKKINAAFIDRFTTVGYITNDQETIFSVLIAVVMIVIAVVIILHEIEILPSFPGNKIENYDLELIRNTNFTNRISAQMQTCKFISNFNKMIHDNNELDQSQAFHERLLQILSESFPSSSEISHQFLFMIYRKLLASKIEDLKVCHLREFSRALLYKLNIPKFTLIKCYSEIIKLDDPVLSKEQINFFTEERNKLQIILNRERTVALQNMKLNLMRSIRKLKLAVEVVAAFS